MRRIILAIVAIGVAGCAHSGRSLGDAGYVLSTTAAGLRGAPQYPFVHVDLTRQRQLDQIEQNQRQLEYQQQNPVRRCSYSYCQ